MRDYTNQRFPDRSMINRDLLPVPATEFTFFHRMLHLFIGINIRCFIGGTMCSSSTANDPVYLLHMAQLDSILTRWQAIGGGRESVRYITDNSALLGALGFTVNQYADNSALPYGTCVSYDPPAIHDTASGPVLKFSSAPAPANAFSSSGSGWMECNSMQRLLEATTLTGADLAFLQHVCP